MVLLYYPCFSPLLFLSRCTSICLYSIVHRFSCRYISFWLKKEADAYSSQSFLFKNIYLSISFTYFPYFDIQLRLCIVFRLSTSENIECFVTIIFFMSYPFFLINFRFFFLIFMILFEPKLIIAGKQDLNAPKFYSFIWAFSLSIFSSKC